MGKINVFDQEFFIIASSFQCCHGWSGGQPSVIIITSYNLFCAFPLEGLKHLLVEDALNNLIQSTETCAPCSDSQNLKAYDVAIINYTFTRLDVLRFYD